MNGRINLRPAHWHELNMSRRQRSVNSKCDLDKSFEIKKNVFRNHTLKTLTLGFLHVC